MNDREQQSQTLINVQRRNKRLGPEKVYIEPYV